MIRVLEAATVTLLGAMAGCWLELLAPAHLHGSETVGTLLGAIWWAGIAGAGYLSCRAWGAFRRRPPNTLPNS